MDANLKRRKAGPKKGINSVNALITVEPGIIFPNDIGVEKASDPIKIILPHCIMIFPAKGFYLRIISQFGSPY
jgi:hypothetical protein